MPKVHRVKKARKDQRSCSACALKITRGMPYIWWKPFRSFKRVRCVKHPPRPSDLTGSDKVAGLLRAGEAIEDEQGRDGTTVEDLVEVLRSSAEDARGVTEEYGYSADAIEEYFSESPTAEECRERADEIEGWADELDAAADEISNMEDMDEAMDRVNDVLGEMPL